jgi:hypothetical protein
LQVFASHRGLTTIIQLRAAARRKVGALNRRSGAGAGTLDSGGKAIRFQMRRKLGGAIHFRIK